MSCYAGPHEVTDSLVGYLDAGNVKSYNSVKIVILLTAGTSWTVPSDWDNNNNTIEAIGAGGGGGKGDGNGFGCGGGGGEWRKTTNVTLTPNGTMAYTIGTAGTAGTTGNGGNGSNTTVMSTTLIAVGGSGGVYSGAAVLTGAAGGTGGTGGTGNSGGAGGTHSVTGLTGGSGGGGAGGPNGSGNAGSNVTSGSGSSGGSGDAGLGGTSGAGAGSSTVGGTGGSGAEYTVTYTWNGTAYTNTTLTVGSGGGAGGGGLSGGGGAGGAYGGGGGGAGTSGGNGGAGASGVIIISYYSTSWKDVSDNRKNGTMSSITVAGTPQYMKCTTASSSMVDLGQNYNYTSESFSVGFWSYVESWTTSNGAQYPVAFYKGAYNVNGYYCSLFSSGPILVTNQSGANQFSQANTSISLNTWYYYTIVRNGSSVRVYINGVDSTSTTGTHVNPTSSSDNFYIGAYNPLAGAGASIFASQRFGMFSIYNRALTAAEVLQNFNALRGRFGI
jgi:hypothetical protein